MVAGIDPALKIPRDQGIQRPLHLHEEVKTVVLICIAD